MALQMRISEIETEQSSKTAKVIDESLQAIEN